jgi:flagellar assembly protein FliH
VSSVSSYEFAQLDGDLARGGADALSAAWAEAEQVRAQARAEGFAAGHAAGLAACADEAAPALAALTGAASALNALGAASVATLQDQAAELAVAIAEQILAGVIAVDRGRVVDVCRGALRRLVDRRKVVVRVNPEDLEILAGEVEALSAQLGGIERFEVQGDRRIDRGGVVVHTDQGEIDATITTQLARAREIVAEALSAGGDD